MMNNEKLRTDFCGKSEVAFRGEKTEWVRKESER